MPRSANLDQRGGIPLEAFFDLGDGREVIDEGYGCMTRKQEESVSMAGLGAPLNTDTL